ncbi:MAG: cell wall-binding repeat-containing protein [Lachnospiraceae bacterium]|nr:cell wall-binding repeat-containing protein [Candidatus Equihabitans merdae]
MMVRKFRKGILSLVLSVVMVVGMTAMVSADEVMPATEPVVIEYMDMNEASPDGTLNFATPNAKYLGTGGYGANAYYFEIETEMPFVMLNLKGSQTSAYFDLGNDYYKGASYSTYYAKVAGRTVRNMPVKVDCFALTLGDVFKCQNPQLLRFDDVDDSCYALWYSNRTMEIDRYYIIRNLSETTYSEAEAEAVVDVINRIIFLGDVTPDDIYQVADIRESYEALSEGQKAYVFNLADLEAAEAIVGLPGTGSGDSGSGPDDPDPNNPDNPDPGNPDNPNPDNPDNPDVPESLSPLGNDPIIRISGATRYETSSDAVAKLKMLSKDQQFTSAVLATGEKFPDALSGCYLAKLLKAPLILVNPSDPASAIEDVVKYVNGNVYILGGQNAVSKELAATLNKYGIKDTRLDGDSRYDTNIKILNAIDSKKKISKLLICNGENYADALSVSSCDMPILMVSDSLNQTQIDWLKSHSSSINEVYAIGGTAAVSDGILQQAASILGCKVGETAQRVAGQNRYETSVKVAEKFFSEDCPVVMLTYAWNFPDGLSGGPIAAGLGAPILLADNNDQTAAAYVHAHGIKQLVVMGGTANMSDQAVKNILG